MEKFLSKIKGKNLSNEEIGNNQDYFNPIIDQIKQKKEREYLSSIGYSDEEIEKLISSLKRSDVYYWFFSIEKIRNQEIDDANLYMLLNKEVLFQSFQSSEEGKGLRNMIMNFIAFNLNPDDVIEVCKDVYALDEKTSKIISDFYRNSYQALQMSFIVNRLTKLNK